MPKPFCQYIGAMCILMKFFLIWVAGAWKKFSKLAKYFPFLGRILVYRYRQKINQALADCVKICDLMANRCGNFKVVVPPVVFSELQSIFPRQVCFSFFFACRRLIYWYTSKNFSLQCLLTEQCHSVSGPILPLLGTRK